MPPVFLKPGSPFVHVEISSYHVVSGRLLCKVMFLVAEKYMQKKSLHIGFKKRTLY